MVAKSPGIRWARASPASRDAQQCVRHDLRQARIPVPAGPIALVPGAHVGIGSTHRLGDTH